MDKEVSRKVCRLVAGLVVTDDHLDPAEDAFITRMLAHFDIPLEERDVIFPLVDADEAVVEMKRLPPAVRHEALGLIIQAACTDGIVQASERTYAQRMGETLGLSAKQIDERLDAELRAVLASRKT